MSRGNACSYDQVGEENRLKSPELEYFLGKLSHKAAEGIPTTSDLNDYPCQITFNIPDQLMEDQIAKNLLIKSNQSQNMTKYDVEKEQDNQMKEIH